MRQITAVFQPQMLGKVMAALHSLPHFPGVTVVDVTGHGRGRGSGGHYEPTVDSIYPKRKTRVEILCTAAVCDELVAAIRNAAHTGKPGDGLVWVVDVSRVVRIRSGQEGEQAV